MKRRWLVTFLAVLFTFSIANAVHAASAWLNVHGTSCVIEYPGFTTNASVAANAATFYKGWGLDFTQKAGLRNWIHAQVPVSGAPTTVGSIKVRYYKSIASSKIDYIDIYDGDKLVASPSPPAGVAGWNEIVVNLGQWRTFYTALGVSIGIAPPSSNTRFIISAVGAYYWDGK